jgi:hypothetical protein
MCLKPSKSKKKHCNFFHVARRQYDGLIRSVVEKHTVGQAGQKVMPGRMDHLVGHCSGGTDVAEDQDGSGSLSVTVVDGGN